MAWIYLFTAGIFEIIWAFSMKQSQGFTVLMPTIMTLLSGLLSVVLLALAMRSLPLGTAYAIWTGIGAIGVFALGIVILGEEATMIRITSVALIGSGIVLMKLGTQV